ncbi:MAG TPA: NAD(P)/FAD-dependent oxidoreductase [Acetobacteraceae bacterium]|jgi:NADPH-dependent 2,4-dienoyl-CoA reductase/sulfur reductase-like enzyme
MTERWDAVVIGAGPAGLAAATLLAEQQARVLLLDEQTEPGGQIYRGIERAAGHASLLAALGDDYRHGAGLVARFRASNAPYRPASVVWQVTPQREVWFSSGGRSHPIEAKAVILATGAMERPVPLPGWTLPGVMTAGALQIMLKSSGAVPAEPFVIAGSGPLFYLLVQQCLAVGARPAAVLETASRANEWRALRELPRAIRSRDLAKGLAMIAALRRSGVPRYRRAGDVRVEGTDAVSGIAFRSGGRIHRLATRVVALHEGVVPAQQMARSIGCAFAWNAVQRCFAPVLDEWGNSSIEGVLIAGDAGGIGGARAAEHAGRLAALEALRRLGRIDATHRDAMASADWQARRTHRAIRRFLDVLYAPRDDILRPADEVMVCRCEEVTAGAVREVVRQGCLGPNQAKAFLRAGMGPCQGRLCGPVVSEIIAEARGASLDEVGYYRIRPPLKPIAVGELLAADA